MGRLGILLGDLELWRLVLCRSPLVLGELLLGLWSLQWGLLRGLLVVIDELHTRAF